VRNSPAQAFLPPDRDLDTWYLLVQDEFSASDSVSIIGGIKLEHNDYTGAEYLPSLRLRWQASRDHTLWAALSHTARAPSRIDRELFVPGTPPFVIEGGPGFRSEVADVVEAGWRGRAGPAFAWSVTAFRHEHERLRSVEPAPDGGFVLANGLEGSTSGLEGWATFHASERWRLSAGGIELRQLLRAAPGVVDVGGLAALGNDPKRSYVFRSSLDFANRQELDVIVRYVGERPNPTVPAYTAVDLRWGWHVNDRTELSLTIDNLTDAEHAEWGPPANRVEFERSWFLKLVVRL
jgi:iron complex outermembrane receptor protein